MDIEVERAQREQAEELYQESLKPFSEDTGTPYLCSQKDIDFHHRNVFRNPNKGPFLTVKESTIEVMWQNDPKRTIPPAEQAAIDRLVKVASDARENLILRPDIIVKAFADFDLVFFAGRLRGHVTVAWAEDAVFTRAWGHCLYSRRPGEKGKCRIQLNAGKILQKGWTQRTPNPFETMFVTLFHEMCHAYTDVRSHHDREEAHGKFFGTRIGVVHKRAMRLLGLWAIEGPEPYRQWHFFLADCKDGRGEHDGKNKREKPDGGEKQLSNLKRGGQRRQHKGTDCVIM